MLHPEEVEINIKMSWLTPYLLNPAVVSCGL
jgi:hypothetical protein